jgi:hypothetical protein
MFPLALIRARSVNTLPDSLPPPFLVFIFRLREWSVTENSMLFNVLDADGHDFHFAPCAPPYVIVKSRSFQRKPMLQCPCVGIQQISFTPLQDIMPFSDMLLCSGVPLKLDNMLAEVRKHARSGERSVPAQELDDCFVGKDVVPLTDCMTGARISLPGRTVYCRHVSAFDLPGFLDAAMKTGLWRCPICLPCSLEVSSFASDAYFLYLCLLLTPTICASGAAAAAAAGRAACRCSNARHIGIMCVPSS